MGLLFLRPALARPAWVFMGTPDLGSSPSSVLTPGQLQTQLGRQAWQPAPGWQGGYLQTGSTSAVMRPSSATVAGLSSKICGRKL